MRWLVLTLLLVSGSVSAEMMVVVEPPVLRMCKAAASWDKMLTCLKRIGEPKILAEGAGVRLVHVAHVPDDFDHDVYLFVPRGRGWAIGGAYNGTDEVLGITAITSAGVHGYRIDLRNAEPYQSDGLSGFALVHEELYCGGDSKFCVEVVTSCDVFVRGRVVSTFRGTARVRGKKLFVEGDRTKAVACRAPDDEVEWHD